MGVYPPIIAKKQNGDVPVNPSCGDGPTKETSSMSSAGSSVLLLPEASNVTVVHRDIPPGASIVRKVSRNVHHMNDRTRCLKYLCLLLVFLSGIAIVALTAVETVRNVQLAGMVNGLVPRFYTSKSSNRDSFHAHKDPSGNIYRNTLASHDHCIHVRKFRIDKMDNEVVHDTETRWSVLVQHNESRCLLFFMDNKVACCPKHYPWHADELMGVVTPQSSNAKSKLRTHDRMVSRLITSQPIPDISCSGGEITNVCKDYLSYEVMAVSVSYMQSRRRSRSVFLSKMKSALDVRKLFDTHLSPLVKPDDRLALEEMVLSKKDGGVLLKKVEDNVEKVGAGLENFRLKVKSFMEELSEKKTGVLEQSKKEEKVAVKKTLPKELKARLKELESE